MKRNTMIIAWKTQYYKEVNSQAYLLIQKWFHQNLNKRVLFYQMQKLVTLDYFRQFGIGTKTDE